MIISYKELSEEALKGVAEQFVISKMSDVDDQPNLSVWVQQVIDMVKKQELLIEYSEMDESVTIKSSSEIDFTD